MKHRHQAQDLWHGNDGYDDLEAIWYNNDEDEAIETGYWELE